MSKNLYFRSKSLAMDYKPTSFRKNKFQAFKLWFVPLALLTVLWACSGDDAEKDEQFCKCMEVGDELNKYSAELLERQATAEDAKKMKELRDQSKKECSKYYQMSGEEMLKRKKACKK